MGVVALKAPLLLKEGCRRFGGGVVNRPNGRKFSTRSW
jgi:hypothetical protein